MFDTTDDNIVYKLKTMTENIFTINIFNRLKTGDPIKDTIITTIILTGITYMIQLINTFIVPYLTFENFSNHKMYELFYKRNIIVYEGKISLSTNFWDSKIEQSNSFGDRFKALLDYITSTMKTNNTIYNIKEYSLLNTHDKNNLNRDIGIYIVNQSNYFLISKEYEIYAYVRFITENKNTEKTTDQKNSRKNSTIEKIVIELFSYKNNIQTIKEFVKNITNNYVSKIEDSRENKTFIYTLTKVDYEECSTEIWDETIFSSTRTFNNLFFEGKDSVIDKLDFFLNNKEWYFEKGIPYSLGIGIHGPPGTGKTSLIKAIANYTKRNIIVISLKLIKTKRQLDSIFFEERYNKDNKKGSITFDKKIIVFEDIDCIGDIVLNRENKLKDSKPTDESIKVSDLLESIKKEKDNNITKQLNKLTNNDEPITLDDILNLWDGIRETPGRILIISSNHYCKLDPALIRPGRIDLTLELSFVSREIISQIYNHLFGTTIDPDKLTMIPSYVYSPAEILNIYINENRDSNKFINRLIRELRSPNPSLL
jgi:DNA replication protein DnaC